MLNTITNNGVETCTSQKIKPNQNNIQIVDLINTFRTENNYTESIFNIFYRELYEIFELKEVTTIDQVKSEHLIAAMLNLHKSYDYQLLQCFKNICRWTFFYLQTLGYYNEENNPHNIIEDFFLPDLYNENSEYDD
ncbi:MAG: hypothetical protein ABR980_08805 [Ignavibacteriaceae bacterium]|jgi:hypothetical protein